VIEALRRRGVPTLLIGSFIGRLPTAMAALALVRLVVDNGGDFAFASALTATYVIAGTIGQPLLGRTVDRFGHPRIVLLAAAAIATLSFVGTALLFTTTPVVAAALVGLAGLATPPIESTLRGLWPELFPESRVLRSAYALDVAVQEIRFIVGPLVTAVGILLLGVNGNIVLMALLGLVGAIVYASRPEIGHARLTVSTKPETLGIDRVPGHGSPLSSWPFRRLLVLVLCAAIPVGAFTLTAAAFAKSLGHPEFGPWALALNATGAVVGALCIAHWPPSASAEHTVRPLAIGLAVLYLPTAIASAPPPIWLAAAFASGLMFTPLLTQIFALTPRVVHRRHATEANAWVISIFAVGVALGTLTAGMTIDAVGIRAGIPIAVLIVVLAGVVGAVQGARRAVSMTAGGVSDAAQCHPAPESGGSIDGSDDEIRAATTHEKERPQ